MSSEMEKNKESSESTSLMNTGKNGENVHYCSNHKGTNSSKVDLIESGNNNVFMEVEKSNGEKIDNAKSEKEWKTDGKSFKFKILSVNLPRRKIIVLLFCTLASFLSQCAFALIAPFFPLVAQKKGMDLTTIGFVFSVYQLVGFVMSPIIGNYLNRIGTKFVYLSGLFVCGIAAICFGVLDKGPNGLPFIVMSILCRSFEALGTSAFTTAGIAIVSSEFPDHIGIVTSALTVGSSLGLMVGPVFGGVLYEFGGFGLPFYITAGLSLLDAIFIYIFLPELETVEHKRNTSILGLVNSFRMIVLMTCVAVGIGGISIYDAIFATHLKPFELSTTRIGAFYLITSSVYTVTSPVWGFVVDSLRIKEPLIMLGLSVFGIGFMISGPSPLLPFVPFELWSVALGFLLLGASLGGILITSLACMVKTAHDLGYEKNVDTHSLVSGLYFSTYSLGGFLGPLTGSSIVQRYGFPNGFTAFGLTCFSTMLFFLGYFLIRQYCNSRRKDNQKERTVTFSTKLKT